MARSSNVESNSYPEEFEGTLKSGRLTALVSYNIRNNDAAIMKTAENRAIHSSTAIDIQDSSVMDQ